MIFAVGLFGLVFILATFQGSLLPFISPWGIQPDLLLVFVLAYSFIHNERGTGVSIGIGLLQDILYGTPAGLFAIAKFASGLFVGTISRYFNREVLLIPLGLCLPVTIIHELVVVFFRGLLLSSNLPIGNLLIYVILPRALVNMIAMAVVFPLVMRLSPKERLFSSQK